ncbi:MAG: hypothetical protein Q7S52_02770 [bacterium]|nr:hypothetical protein [bacterium]
MDENISLGPTSMQLLLLVSRRESPRWEDEYHGHNDVERMKKEFHERLHGLSPKK